ncbi:MAG: hypothetical protein KKB31_05670, partial [Nanoarchaeota archaeon]|nr:hypothetical protein [Nanoarchaeota archaeon]
DYFKLAHNESSYVVEALREQGLYVGEIVYYQGLQGPIKIWEISYPSDIEANPKFLQKTFPNPELFLAKPGEY